MKKMSETIQKRALFFIQNGLGGAERITIEIAKMLISDGWLIDMTIILKNENDDTTRIESFLPKKIISINRISCIGQINFLTKLFNNIKKSDASIVFASAMHINQRILLISPLFPKVKFIIRNDNYLYTLPKIKQKTISLTYRFADAIITQTEEMEIELQNIGLKKNRIHTLHNPINSNRIKSLANVESPFSKDDKLKFVSVGRIAHQKGYDLLIKAFAEVIKVYPKSELYIIGDTNYENGIEYKKLLEIISLLKLSDLIHFIGFDANPYKYIKNADVYVLSSRYEGLPNTLIEAQFLGTPCAAFECIPIIGRIINNGINGYLARPEDTHSLATAMMSTLSINNIKMIYKPSKSEDFVLLFNSIK